MAKYDVYGIGNALVDFQFSVDEATLEALAVDKGLMTLVDESRSRDLLKAMHSHTGLSACGGSAANSMIAVSQFGAKSFYSCKVASDELGDFYTQDLQAWGVDSNLQQIERQSGRTGTCVVLVTPDSQRSMSTHLGITADFSVHELDAQALSQSRYLYIEGYLVASDSAIEAALQAKAQAEAAGVKTALTLSDENMIRFFKPRMDQLTAPAVDLLFSNESEALLMAESDTLEQALSYLKTRARAFAVTCGAKGALVWDGSELHQVEAPKVEAIDTNGAGDMFAGTFLAMHTQGKSMRESAAIATQAASHLVGHFGPRFDHEAARAVRSKILP